MSDFVKVLKKAVDDPEFPARLAKDPNSALKEVGVEPTPEKIQALQTATPALAQAHRQFGGAMKPE